MTDQKTTDKPEAVADKVDSLVRPVLCKLCNSNTATRGDLLCDMCRPKRVEDMEKCPRCGLPKAVHSPHFLGGITVIHEV